MSEIISTYEVRDPDVFTPMDRDEFYIEQIKTIKKTGKASRMTEIVAVLLFNHDGEIILQKRSHDKAHNPYLIDKAIGGHVKYGDSPLYTVMVETVQELRVPSIVLRNDEDFRKTYKLLSNYTENIAIIKEIEKIKVDLERVIDGEVYIFPQKVHLYVGIYNGATKPVDKEASGVLYYSLDILKKEMSAQKSNFTYDLQFYLDKYSEDIQKFLSHLKK